MRHVTGLLDETIALYKRHMLAQHERAEAAEARCARLQEQLDAALAEARGVPIRSEMIGARYDAPSRERPSPDSTRLPKAGEPSPAPSPSSASRSHSSKRVKRDDLMEIARKFTLVQEDARILEARCARLQQAAGYAEGVLMRDPFDEVQRQHAAQVLREALAGPDTPADSQEDKT